MGVHPQGKDARLAPEGDRALAILAGGRGAVCGPSLDTEFARQENRAGGLAASEIQDSHPGAKGETARQALRLAQGVFSERVVAESIAGRTSPRGGTLSARSRSGSQNLLLMLTGLRGAPASSAKSAAKLAIAGKAKDVADVLALTPRHRLGSAVMAVAAHQDFDRRPPAARRARPRQ
jgi:hypothetical protein